MSDLVDQVVSYFNNECIPFYRNLSIKDSNEILTNINFVIPNAVVQVECGNIFAHESKMLSLHKKLQVFHKIVPEHYIIYVLAPHRESPERFKKVRDDDFYSILEISDRIKFISKVEEIEVDIENIPYYCDNPRIIFNVITSYLSSKPIEQFKGKLYINKSAHNKAMCGLYENQLDKIKDLKFNIVEDFCTTKTHIKISQDEIPDDPFTCFNIVRKYRDIRPQRLVENITKKCDKCNKIYFIDDFCC